MSDPPLARDGGAGEKGGGGLSLPGGDLSRSPVPSTGSGRDTPTPGPTSTSTLSSSTPVSAPLPAANAAALPQGRGSHAKGTSAPASSTTTSSSTHASRSSPATTATLAWAGGRTSVGSSISSSLRSYAQIHADATAASSSSSPYTNIILQFRLSKVQIEGDGGVLVLPKSLTHDQFGDYIFDVLKINHEDCLEIDLSGRWDTKELVLKAGTLVDHLVTTNQPQVYLNHEITITPIIKNSTKVYFKNVPTSVPDEEIIHLCMAYSDPVDGRVHRETMRLGTTTRRNVIGTTRYVEVRLHPGKFLRNFYWLEGPLPGDQGRRITILHNQPQQCSNCFRYAPSNTPSGIPCPGGGNGKLCEAAKTPRARMSEYMVSLRLQDRYVPMKTMYFEQKEKSFPGLTRRGQRASNLDNITGSTPFEEVDSLDSLAIQEQEIVVQSPLEQRETEVVLLRRELETLQVQVEEARSSREQVSRSAAILKESNQDQHKRLSYARRNQETRLVELFRDLETNWESSESSHLVNSYSACLSLGDFEYDHETALVKPKTSNFMKFMELNCRVETKQQQQIFTQVKSLVLARLTDIANLRSRSMSEGSSSRRLSVSETLKRDRESDTSPKEGSQASSKVKLTTLAPSPTLPPASTSTTTSPVFE